MSISEILGLLSGVALFLYGMTLMGDNLKKVAGNSLEIILYKLAGSPLKGILLGTGVTGVIQSSSATAVMVVGFVNSGMMKVKQAIGVIMGAIIGTSVTGWIISLSSIESAPGVLELLSTDSLTAIIAIIGIVLRMFGKHTKQRNIGDILLGFAVLMFGMKTMSSSVSGLRQSPTFVSLLTEFNNPILGILIGAAFTAVIQSASAAVGILQALSTTGTISFSLALPVLMGIAIGASVPVILSSIGSNVDAKRSAWSYLVIDFLGCGVISILYYPLNSIFHFSFDSLILNTFTIALLNSIFRGFMIALLSPFISFIEKITKIIIKDDEEEEERYDEDKLEDRFLAHPAIAIEQVRIVINQMAELARDNVIRACELIKNYDEKLYKKVKTKEDIVDNYADKLGTYLVKITRKELNKKQNGDVSKYLQTITDLERISDHASNIADIANSIIENKVSFSDKGLEETHTIITAIEDMLTLSIESFIKNDSDLAFEIPAFEELIDDICAKMKENHVGRIREGVCTLEHGIVLSDLLTDIERVADHAENIALYIVQEKEMNTDVHRLEKELMNKHQDNFEVLLNQYREKYHI